MELKKTKTDSSANALNIANQASYSNVDNVNFKLQNTPITNRKSCERVSCDSSNDPANKKQKICKISLSDVCSKNNISMLNNLINEVAKFYDKNKQTSIFLEIIDTVIEKLDAKIIVLEDISKSFLKKINIILNTTEKIEVELSSRYREEKKSNKNIILRFLALSTTDFLVLYDQIFEKKPTPRHVIQNIDITILLTHIFSLSKQPDKDVIKMKAADINRQIWEFTLISILRTDERLQHAIGG